MPNLSARFIFFACKEKVKNMQNVGLFMMYNPTSKYKEDFIIKN